METGRKIYGTKIPYGWIIYLICMLAINALIFMPPLLVANEQENLASSAYFAWSFTCHQLDTRSLCYYEAGFLVRDCDGANTGQKTEIIFSKSCLNDGVGAGSAKCTASDIGYKFPVCARDFGIYLSMLIGGIIYPLVKKANEQNWPHPIWLVLAMVPIAIDGSGQFLGFWESTNTMRLLTGGIIGIVMSFYIIPMLNQLINPVIESIFGRMKK
ncbi:MAG: DUF2085 domain-containing protein [Candidatus Micrarchaeia archaeon]